jgi:hypothetical protein
LRRLLHDRVKTGRKSAQIRRILADHARRLVLLEPSQIEGDAAGENLAEYQAERVHIARGGDRLSADLFRAGVLEREVAVWG